MVVVPSRTRTPGGRGRRGGRVGAPRALEQHSTGAQGMSVSSFVPGGDLATCMCVARTTSPCGVSAVRPPVWSLFRHAARVSRAKQSGATWASLFSYLSGTQQRLITSSLRPSMYSTTSTYAHAPGSWSADTDDRSTSFSSSVNKNGAVTGRYCRLRICTYVNCTRRGQGCLLLLLPSRSEGRIRVDTTVVYIYHTARAVCRDHACGRPYMYMYKCIVNQ